MRVLVVGLGDDRRRGRRVHARRAAHDVTVLEDRPGRARRRVPRPGRAGVADGARGWSRRRRRRRPPRLGAAPTSWCRARACTPTTPRSSRPHAAGVPVRSEIDLAAARLRARPDAPRLVAVTGTNGKTTVTTLIDAMLRAAGIASVAAGNIGRPLLDAAGDDVDGRRRRGVVVPARAHHRRVRARRRGPAERRRGPPRLARVGRRLRRGQGPRLRAPGEPTALLVVNARRPGRRRPGRHRARPGRSGSATGAPAPGGYGVRDGRAGRSGRGALAPVPDVGRAARRRQRAGRRRRGDGGRRRRRRGGRGARRLRRARRTGCSWWASATACASTTTPRPPTRTPPSARCAGFEHVVLIAGGRNKALDLGGAARARAPRLRAVVAIGEAAGEVEAAFAGAVPVVRRRLDARRGARRGRRAPRRRCGAAVARVRVVRLVRQLRGARRRLRPRGASCWWRRRLRAPTEDPHDRVHESRPRPPPPRGARDHAPSRGARSSTAILLVATVAVLNVVGVVMVLSASSVASLTDYGSPWYFFLRQLMWTVLGLVAFVFAVRVRLPTLARAWYGRCSSSACVLLVVVLVPGVGIYVSGSRRWLGCGLRALPAQRDRQARAPPLRRRPREPAGRRAARLAPGAAAGGARPRRVRRCS